MLFRSVAEVGEEKDIRLVFVAHHCEPEPEIAELAKSLPIVYVSADDRELTEIMSVCSCLAYTSAIEGFGLPILEGLYSGIQVIASDILPHREAGMGFWDSIQYFDPFDSEALFRVLINCYNGREKKVNPETLNNRRNQIEAMSSQQIGRAHV